MEVQKQLKDLGVPDRQAKKAADLMKAHGFNLGDLLVHLPEILALIEQAGGLFGKLFKKSSPPLSVKR